MDLIKITPDIEKAKSIMKMIGLIEERIKIQYREKMTSLIIVDYYEIVKEIITAILLTEGYKTLSHKDLIEYIKGCKDINESDISILDDLRILRNRVAYEGVFVDISYLKNNEKRIMEIIKKLKNIIRGKLK